MFISGANIPQLSLYGVQEQCLKIENEAHTEKMPLSKWGVSKIMERIAAHYPEGWADVFGSISASLFTRPDHLRFTKRDTNFSVFEIEDWVKE